jgi:hypothetical protein
MGLKHMKLQQLTDYLDIAKDDEKQRINNEIEKLRFVKNKIKIQKYTEYRKQYYQDNIKWKIKKVKSEEPMILKERKEIKRDDGTIEYQEVWRDKEDRMNNKKTK